MVNACYLWVMRSVGSGSLAADPVSIFLQVCRGGKPTLRLKVSLIVGGRSGGVGRIDEPPAPWQLSPTTIL
jgi:hypothetical protein